MDESEVKQLIETGIADSEARVKLEGSNCQLTVIASAFEGLNSLKKQQLVYACLNDKIASGEIHAVTMETFTPQDWEQQKKFRGL